MDEALAKLTREEFEAGLQHAQAIFDFVLNLLPVDARP
jgi:hypothetical protein